MNVGEKLARFAPQVQLRDVLAGFDDGTKQMPSQESGHAALLFIDLSGFTALTERSAARGRRGAENLTEIINQYFGKATDLILDHGGDILFYAGDSILAIWPAEKSESLAEAAQMAAGCALEIQVHVSDQAKTESDSLRFRASVTSGAVSFLQVGGAHDIWQFLVSGKPVVEIAENDRCTRPGEVVVTQSTWQLIDKGFVGNEIDQGRRKLVSRRNDVTARSPDPVQVPIGAETVLVGLVPSVVATRTRAGYDEWLAEFRNIVVLFINFVGLDQTETDLLDKLQPIVKYLQEIITGLEGTVYQLLMDDKGASMVVGFGLPPFAHEDDARRATLAAIEIREWLANQGVEASIGIASGPLYCGIYGTERRQQYTIAGSAINLAARLMQKADGRILCDTSVASRAQVNNAFEPLHPITMKGHSSPTSVFRVQTPDENTTTAITRQTTNIAIFGRDEETAKIEQALREAQNEGAGSLLLLEGDAGIGKSTLMEYAASRAQDLNIAALKGGADAIRKDSSFYPWRQVFATLLELEPGSENTEEMTSRLIQSLPKERRQLAPLLSAVLPYEIPDNDVTKRMSEEVRADNTLSLLLEVLGTATENGSIGIFLEDAHWFDSASWKLISLVARSNDSILFVISTRPTEVEHPLLSSLFELGGANKLHVSPLSAPATVDLVCHRLGVDSTPESVSEFVMEKAGGNPFFSEELAYALLESGVITIADRVCELADPDTDPGKSMANMLADKGLPDTIQGIVTSRIDRLSEQLQFAIKVASAIGVRFTVDSLVAVYPEATSKKSMLRWLDELSEGDFIDVDSENSGVFEFRHVITRDVAYHSMLFSQRRKLHRRIASWFEEQSNSTSESMQPVLAHHWQHADEWERATSYLTRAGDNAMRNFSNREAISFYSDALEISNKASEDGQGFATTDDRRHWKLSIGRAHLKESEYQTGRTHIEQGLSLAGIEMKKGKLRPIFGLFSQMGRQVLHRYRAGRIVGSRHDDRKSLLEQARALEGLVEAYFVANENIRCLHCAFQSLNIAELAGPSPELARGYASVGAIMGFIPLHGIAKKYCDRAMDAAEKTDEPETLAWVSLAYGVYEAGAGNLDEARRHLFNTTAVAKKRGDRRRWDDGTQNLAATAYIRGELDKSLEFGSDLFSSAERRGDKKDQAEALRWIIRVRLARRNLEKLPELIQRFLDLRQGESGIGEKYSADVRVAQADFVYAAGDLAKAQALADDAMTLVGRGPSNFYDVFVEQSALADIYYALFSNATSNKNFSQLNSLVNVIKRHARVFAVAEPTARYWDGVIKRLRGRHKAARAALESAIDCAERMKMPIQEARIRAELAKNKTISESARERHLAGAVKILSAARARSDLARIDAN